MKNLIKKVFKNIKTLKKQDNNLAILNTTNNYQDLINPYQLVFNPSYLETNEKYITDFFVLNDMSGEKTANYMLPLLKHPKKSKASMFFSPINSSAIVTQYKKELVKLNRKYETDIAEGKEENKKLKRIIEDYSELVEDLDDGRDSLLNYSILYSHELPVDFDDQRRAFQDERETLTKFFNKNIQQPSKYYPPVGQIEEAYISQQPLCEYRLKDWSSISATNGMTLYPFFTETKEPSIKDGVPYGINRNTGELLFFNHSQYYNDGKITNRNLNVFGGTGAGKTSFFRSQVPMRIGQGDHFIIFDPKKDYVSFTKDMGGQNISFSVDKPMGFNLFTRSIKTYKKIKEVNGKKIEEEIDVQSLEDKKQNLIKIFSIMCPYLTESTDSAEFSLTILDSAISLAYNYDGSGEKVAMQNFYDIFLKKSILYFSKNEPEKISNYTQAGERLRTNLSAFVKKEDGSFGRYYKMFLPVKEEDKLILGDGPLINFDLSGIFNDDKLFAICTLIGFEFTWAQVATKKWENEKILYVVIDENWKLLKYEKAAEYEEAFSRLIRGLGGGIYTFSQNLTEYVESKAGSQVLAQAQTNIVLKLEANQLEKLKTEFPLWFTPEINEDFARINEADNSYGQGYIYMKGRALPFKYLYLPFTENRDSWQEAKAWQGNLDSSEGYEIT